MNNDASWVTTMITSHIIQGLFISRIANQKGIRVKYFFLEKLLLHVKIHQNHRIQYMLFTCAMSQPSLILQTFSHHYKKFLLRTSLIIFSLRAGQGNLNFKKLRLCNHINSILKKFEVVACYQTYFQNLILGLIFFLLIIYTHMLRMNSFHLSTNILIISFSKTANLNF